MDAPTHALDPTYPTDTEEMFRKSGELIVGQLTEWVA